MSAFSLPQLLHQLIDFHETWNDCHATGSQSKAVHLNFKISGIPVLPREV
jgi:hypothetical protein